MEDYQNYLLDCRITTPKQAVFYVHWVTLLLRQSGKQPENVVTQADVDRFIKHE